MEVGAGSLNTGMVVILSLLLRQLADSHGKAGLSASRRMNSFDPEEYENIIFFP
jgi:hypothetical protein